MKHDKTIIFDLDGTIYKFEGGHLKSSGLYKVIIKNTLIYISQQLRENRQEAQKILSSIMQKYGNSLSIGLEKEFQFDRYDYFNFAWDINVKKFVQFNPDLKPLFSDLKNDYNLVLVSDAPLTWINNVLKYLEVQDSFKKNIFSGEGDVRKEIGNAFKEITKKLKLKPNDCVSIGDQENTDIIPAKEMGMKTIYISNDKSNIADYTIDNILKINDILKQL